MDLNLKHKLGVGRLIKKRDVAHGEIRFSEKYLELYEHELSERKQKELAALDLKAKKALLPFEEKAVPASELNEYYRKKEMESFTKKQQLPRRAVNQTGSRVSKKQGEAAGKAYIEKNLKILDDKLADFEKKLLAKYPDVPKVPASAAHIEEYSAQESGWAKRHEELDAKLTKEHEAILNKEKAKAAAKNAKLGTTLSGLNAELSKLYQGNEGELAEGDIMSIKNMRKYFQGIKAVDDLTIDIKEGEIFGLIGPNGAGKTTLFNCITQFYKPDGGKIHYRDRFGHVVDLSVYDSHDVAMTGIVRTFQNLALVPIISVLDNLMIGAHIYYNSGLFHQFLKTRRLRYEEKANKAMAMDILERLDLIEYKDVPPMSLSYGVRKKVELARTLMIQPRLIILDEPAAGLNDQETDLLADIIRKIRDDYSCTIFLVEHDMNLVMNVCNTVCAISFGKKLAVGTPEEIQENPLVQEAYLGSDEEEGS